jgi:hypothetical protein
LVNQQDQLFGQPAWSTSLSTRRINQFVNQQDQRVGQPTRSTGWPTNKINQQTQPD